MDLPDPAAILGFAAAEAALRVSHLGPLRGDYPLAARTLVDGRVGSATDPGDRPAPGCRLERLNQLGGGRDRLLYSSSLTRFMDEIYKYLFFHSPGHDLQFRHRQWMHPHAGEYRVVNMTTLERRVQRARCPSIALNPRETLLPSVGPGSNLTGLPGTHAIVNKRELCSGLQQKEDQDMTGNHIWGGRPGISTKSGAE